MQVCKAIYMSTDLWGPAQGRRQLKGKGPRVDPVHEVGGALLGMKTRGAELRLAEQRTFLRLPAKWLCGDPRRQRSSCTCPSHSRVEGAGKGVRFCTCPSHSRVEGTGEGVRRHLAPGQRPAEQGRKLDPDRGWGLLPAPGHPAGWQRMGRLAENLQVSRESRRRYRASTFTCLVLILTYLALSPCYSRRTMFPFSFGKG